LDCVSNVQLENGTVEPWGKIHVELTSIEANVPVEESEFAISFPPGTRVYDSDARTYSVVTPSGAREALPEQTAVPTGPVARTDFFQPRLWYWLAGVLTMGVAFILWRRSRTA